MTRYVAYDTETYPIHQVGKSTNDTMPRLVVLSWADADNPAGTLLDRMDAIAWWHEQLYDEDVVFVGANLAFDLNVMLRATVEEGGDEAELFRQVFAKTKWDVQVQARLEDIARGGMFLRGQYNLGALEARYAPEATRSTEKKGINVWRLRYNELEGVPVDEYPADAARYALEDAVNTWAVFDAMNNGPQGRTRNYQATALRSQYDWELSLMSGWGVLVDQDWTAKLVEFYSAQRDEARAALVKHKLVRGADNEDVLKGKSKEGTKDMKAVRSAFEEAFLSIGQSPPRTKSGKAVATDKAAMNVLEDEGAMTPAFEAYARFNRADKFIGTYLMPLVDAGDLPLCPRFNVIVDSGRTSSSGPNVQNFPARTNSHDKQILREMLEDYEEMEDEVRMMRGFITGPDIRGAVIPAEGNVFVAADYSAVEMAGVAQNARNLFGELGTLGQAINEGLDLHNFVGAQLLGIPYEEFTAGVEAKDPSIVGTRTVSKIGNYGYWGGAAARTFRGFARQQGEHVDLYTAEQVKSTMARTWSEMDPYFRYISQQQQPNGSYYIQQHGPDRRTSGWRLRVTKKFTQAANTLFQGIVADGALWSMHLIMEEIYLKPESPLFGTRLVLFVHDEFVLEVEAARAAAAGDRMAELMVKGMKRFLPDLLVEAKPSIMETRWTK